MRKIAGRPKKYSVQAFRRGVNRYFAEISREKAIKEKIWTGRGDDGKDIYEVRPVYNELGNEATVREYLVKPSIAGLCSHLSICRDTFNEYSRTEGYSEICAAVKNEIESYLCSQLGNGKGDSGIIFNLTHNFGWKNRIEVDAGEETRKSLERVPVTTDDKVRWLMEHGYTVPGVDEGAADDDG